MTINSEWYPAHFRRGGNVKMIWHSFAQPHLWDQLGARLKGAVFNQMSAETNRWGMRRIQMKTYRWGWPRDKDGEEVAITFHSSCPSSQRTNRPPDSAKAASLSHLSHAKSRWRAEQYFILIQASSIHISCNLAPIQSVLCYLFISLFFVVRHKNYNFYDTFLRVI